LHYNETCRSVIGSWRSAFFLLPACTKVAPAQSESCKALIFQKLETPLKPVGQPMQRLPDGVWNAKVSPQKSSTGQCTSGDEYLTIEDNVIGGGSCGEGMCGTKVSRTASFNSNGDITLTPEGSGYCVDRECWMAGQAVGGSTWIRHWKLDENILVVREFLTLQGKEYYSEAVFKKVR
jgi:hypothetical protein